MFFISKLITCSRSQAKYEALQKKNDDFGIKAAECWAEQHPLNSEIRGWNYIEINKYALSIIRNLKQVPITSSNLAIIKDHLIMLAKQHDLLRQYLIKHMPKIKADGKTISDLKVELISTYSG